MMKDRSKTVLQLSEMVQGEVVGDADLVIHRVADLGSARDGDITFIAKAKISEEVESTSASAVIIPLSVDRTFNKAVIKVRDPYYAITVIHNYFLKKPFVAEGVSPKAEVGSDCEIPAEVTVCAMAVVGNRVTLGKRVTIYPGVVIGDEVVIGDDTTLHANVSIRSGCTIGSRVIIHNGAVIGSDGFGYATDEVGRHCKRPHVGNVRIDDDVEIGANVCIDRATFGTTRVKRGTKIDNLVQLGHNVVVGEDSLLVAQGGISGSTTLGKGVVMGGQVGISGHLKLGDRVMVGAKSGVHNNQDDGAIISGIPAVSHKVWLRASTAFAKLPDLVREMRDLRKKITDLYSKIEYSEKLDK